MSTSAQPKKGGGRTVAIAVLVVVVIVAVAGFYVLSGMGSAPNTTSTTNTSAQSVIKIASGTGSSNSLNFSPASLTLVIGTNNTVVWQNDDTVAHTITFTSAPAGVSVSSLSDPNNLAASGSYSVTLTVPGTYQYHCTIHSWMTGTITVVQ